jgi:hypothetical protein
MPALPDTEKAERMTGAEPTARFAFLMNSIANRRHFAQRAREMVAIEQTVRH